MVSRCLPDARRPLRALRHKRRLLAGTVLFAAAAIAASTLHVRPAKLCLATPTLSAGRATAGAAGTELVYLQDSKLLQLRGCELLETLPREQGLGVVLDRSIFHPQGGGQPSDTGKLESTGLPRLRVSSARIEEGTVMHHCEGPEAELAEWLVAANVSVTCLVDEGPRRRAAQLHSAGHLLDVAVLETGLVGWEPGKGYHFEDGPYVEYILDGPAKAQVKGEKAEILGRLQEKVTGLIARGGPVVAYVGEDGLRRVSMFGQECPCGGTHIEDAGQLCCVEVRKIKLKKNRARVSYTVAPEP